MATQKELVFKLKFVDENGAVVEKTAESIKDINKSITDLRNELENTELGSEAWNELAEDLGKAENALEKTTEAINDTKNAQKSLGDQLTSAPGIVGQVSNSVKGLGKTFKALLANPVVAVIAAIVGALTLLFKAFTSTKAGGEAFDRVMAGIGAALDVLRDRVLKVGGAIIKFFSGDFAGAAEDIKGAFSGIGEEIAGEFQQAMEIKRELQAITDATRELNKERARQNKEIAAAKLVINDETKSYEERQAALEQVRQAEIALAKQEEILAQRRYDAIKAQNALSDSSKEALDEEAAAYAALQQAQQASLQKQKELYDQQKALRDRQRAEQKAAADKRKQELQQLADLEFQLNQELEEDNTQRALNELAIQEESLKQQVKNLKLSKEKESELILKIERTTQKKREQIFEESYNTSLAKLNDFTQKLIDQQKSRDNRALENAQDRYDRELRTLEKNINDQEALEEIRALMLEGKFREAYEKQGEYLDARQRANETYFGKYMRADLEMLELTKDYYDTLEFEAQQKLEADLEKFEETKDAEIKAQKETAKEVFRVRTERSKQREEELLATEKDEKKRLEIMSAGAKERIQIAEDYNTTIANTDEFFKNYEKQRTEEYEAERLRIQQEANDKLIEVNRQYQEKQDELDRQRVEASMARMDLIGAGLTALTDLLSDDFAFKKEIAAAETLFATYQAAQQAYLSQLAIPTPDAPIRANVAAGIAVAQGLARVASIYAVEDPNAADGMVVGQGSGRMDNVKVNVSNGESIINARSTSMFKPLLSAINQAGGGRRFAAGGITGLSTQTSPETNLLNQISQLQGNAPIKTYVVSSDVSSSVSLDRQIKSRSVL